MKSSLPRSFPLRLAEKTADELMLALAPYCSAIAVAGSVRRRRPTVHDVDLVLHPKIAEGSLVTQEGLFGVDAQPVMVPAFMRYLVASSWVPVGAYPQAGWPGIVKLEGFPLPVELYLSHFTGCNYGALLQMRTGPEELNIVLSGRARFLGFQYRAGHGVFDVQGARLDSGSEDGVFTALGLRPIPVDKRGNFGLLHDWLLPGWKP